MLRGMKSTGAIVLLLLGFGAVAVVLEGPLQVWLLVLAPFALIAIASLLHFADRSKSDFPMAPDAETNQYWRNRGR
jgi:hypothetical protein